MGEVLQCSGIFQGAITSALPLGLQLSLAAARFLTDFTHPISLALAAVPRRTRADRMPHRTPTDTPGDGRPILLPDLNAAGQVGSSVR